MAPVGSRSTVRRRVLLTMVGVTVLALLAFGLPLALSVAALHRSQRLTTLHAEGSRAAALIADDLLLEDVTAVRLPALRATSSRLGLYDSAGARVAGVGPGHDTRAGSVATTGTESDQVSGEELAVILPVAAAHGQYAIRVAADLSSVRSRTLRTWLIMLALAAAALTVAILVARRRTDAIIAPLDALVSRSESLGEGNFALPAVHSGLAEIDRVANSLVVTGDRLGRMLERERHFSADASHQLRTPMTRVRLVLESALLDPDADPAEAIEAALEQLDGLEETVTGLLALARGLPEGTERICAVVPTVQDTVSRWRSRDRQVRAVLPTTVPDVRVSAVAVRQALDVLIENALQHGDGEVVVTVREAGGGVAVDVADRGPGLGEEPERLFERGASTGGSTGIGLALARSLVEIEGGRLLAGRPTAGALLTLLLPAVERGVGSVGGR